MLRIPWTAKEMEEVGKTGHGQKNTMTGCRCSYNEKGKFRILYHYRET